MKQEIAFAWADDLESGKYQQTRAMLCDLLMPPTEEGKDYSMGFCCLGVLTDQAVRAGVGEWVESDSRVYHEVGDETEYKVMNRAVRRWAGFKSLGTNGSHAWLDEKMEEMWGTNSLAQANDEGAEFKEIAAFIREHWADL